MSAVGRFVREAFGVLAGGVVYAVLNLIPLIGPFAAGFVVGVFSSGGAKRAFNLGVASGLLGFVFFGLALQNLNFLDLSAGTFRTFILAWILLVWNVLGLLACGLGAVAGVIMRDFGEFYRNLRKSHTQPKESIVYRICPACNEGTPDKTGFCVKCGSAIL